MEKSKVLDCPVGSRIIHLKKDGDREILDYGDVPGAIKFPDEGYGDLSDTVQVVVGSSFAPCVCPETKDCDKHGSQQPRVVRWLELSGEGIVVAECPTRGYVICSVPEELKSKQHRAKDLSNWDKTNMGKAVKKSS